MFSTLIDASMSAIPQLSAMFGGLRMASPMMEPFIKFLNIFQAAMTAGMASAITLLYEKLFTEKNVEIMIALGEATGKTFGDKMEKAIENADVLGKGLEKLSPHIDAVTKALKPFNDEVDDLNAFIADGTVNMDKMVKTVKDLKEVIDNINDSIEEFIDRLRDE